MIRLFQGLDVSQLSPSLKHQTEVCESQLPGYQLRPGHAFSSEGMKLTFNSRSTIVYEYLCKRDYLILAVIFRSLSAWTANAVVSA